MASQDSQHDYWTGGCLVWHREGLCIFMYWQSVHYRIRQQKADKWFCEKHVEISLLIYNAFRKYWLMWKLFQHHHVKQSSQFREITCQYRLDTTNTLHRYTDSQSTFRKPRALHGRNKTKVSFHFITWVQHTLLNCISKRKIKIYSHITNVCTI